MTSIPLTELFTPESALTYLFEPAGSTRSHYKSEQTEIILDQFESLVQSVFVRLSGATTINIRCDEPYTFTQTEAGGYLGISDNPNASIFWIPEQPITRTINPDKSIAEEQKGVISGFSWQQEQSSLQFSCVKNSVLDLTIWKFPATFSVQQLNTLLPTETQGAFLWGSHGCINRPSDLYRHLINGAVYDLRFSWPHSKKCFSENEAHALYTTFSGLEKTTGKSLYRFFQQQIVLSIIQRQAADGGFYHGMWTDETECHYRLHTSAVHLLLDEFQRTSDEQVKATLEKAVSFLSKTTDQLDCGTWFLHDSLELSEAAMNSGPFKWISNRTLGKSVSNMLVLNTHLDTSIAINRYGQLTGDLQYQPLVDSALQSTRAVLGLQPADWLYKPLFWAIGLTMIPTEKARELSAPVRAIKRLAWQYLTQKLPDIKARFPRLVMPNGYIDRELSLRTWAIDYQTINLMDLARYARAFPGEFDEAILDKALEFTQTSGLIKRYRELPPGKRYAPGFWMEALYHRCLSKGDLKYRQWLVEAMLECHDLGFGIAPSLMGANGEATHLTSAVTLPRINNAELISANLSNKQQFELLLVNTSEQTITIAWDIEPTFTINWRDTSNRTLPNKPLTLTAGSGLVGTASYS
jgi:hypothetical protein